MPGSFDSSRNLLDPHVKEADADNILRNVSEQMPLLITNALDRTVRVGRIRIQGVPLALFLLDLSPAG